MRPGRTIPLIALLGALALTAGPAVGAGTPAAAGAADDSAEEMRLVLDDFSGYTDDAALDSAYTRNANGGQNTATLVDSPFGDGLGQAMRFDYSFTSGYSGRYRAVNGYWPGLRAVELWVQHSAPGQDVLLQLSDGASYEAHLNAVPGFDATSTAPQHLRIPIEAFARKEGTGTGTLNPKGVTTFALYVNQVVGGSGGTIVLDEISLVFDELPDLPSVAFDDTHLVADGVSNLVTLLNRDATLPAGAKIVQVSYASSNPDVVPDFDRPAPKADFVGEGTATVQLQQVRLFLDGTTFAVDLDTELEVEVRNLPAPVDVIEYFRDLTGHGVLSAMHHDQGYANPATADVLHQRVANEFGVYPALYSADFLTGNTVAQRQNMIGEVIRQWRNGNLVQIMFHVSPPQYTVAQEAEGNWGGDQAHETLPSPNRIYSYLYNDQWAELMTDGTPLNTNWKLRMDEYARYLQQLEDAGVTVMLRPFHEMQQHVFWWGGRPGLEGSAGLYRMFHDYLENEKGLTNIVWVWNIQDLPTDYGWADGDAKFDRYEGLDGGLAEYDADDWNSFNPGADYYDILSVDFYDEAGYEPRHYDQAERIAAADGGKPIWIGETFTFPSQEVVAAQPDWALAMPWGVRTWNYNTHDAMATWYENSIGASGLPRFATLDTSKPKPPIGEPVAAGEASMTPDLEGRIGVSATRVAAGDTVEISLGAERAGEYAAAVLYSEPRVLGGWQQSSDEGTIAAAIPADTEPGVHRLAAQDASGAVIGWVAIEILADPANEEPAEPQPPATGEADDAAGSVAGADGRSLATTGWTATWALLTGAALALAGAFVLVLRRRTT
ncbi:hypothetical protein FLP10_08345 [Agromyces intestinalis]|uniref:GH26 domain-containing protein n=1 Tax=Agromyces intestinalis TaxID=2592652 RepID=A0A5C1YE84_9MICO|nr:glycosyl hydrolase [Agromyces intestinalis]QEO14431.1 hypothetical protein FLP10_08345 [Agromyces intestinalis]